jgi:hypothetical protein
MKDVFSRAGIEVTKENKKALDRAIHSYVGIEYKDCSSTWKKVMRRSWPRTRRPSSLCSRMPREDVRLPIPIFSTRDFL